MIEGGKRRRNQPAPPHIVFEALTEPERVGGRPWLVLLADEVPPVVVRSGRPSVVVWSSLWPVRPDAQIRFDLPTDGGCGTDLCWTLELDESLPEPSLLGHLRHRINKLINGDLRRSFGQ